MGMLFLYGFVTLYRIYCLFPLNMARETNSVAPNDSIETMGSCGGSTVKYFNNTGVINTLDHMED